MEVVGVIRQAVRRSSQTERDGLVALADFRLLPARRGKTTLLLDRARYASRPALLTVCTWRWQAPDVPLVTCGALLSRSHGHRAAIEVP